MSFPLLLECLNERQKERIYADTQIEPRCENTYKGQAADMLSKMIESFSFFDIPTKEQINLPFFYARSKLGKDVVPGEGSWSPLEERFLAQHVTLRDYQKEIVDEALGHLEEHYTTTIVIPPGKGKTIIGTFLASKLGLKTAYIYPSNLASLSGQWLTTQNKVFMETETEKDLEEIKENIIFPPIPSLSHKYDWDAEFNFILTSDERVSAVPLSVAKRIGTLVIDEGDRLCTPSRVKTLLRFSPKYVIILTATPVRPDGAHKMLSLLAGEHGVFQYAKDDFLVLRKKMDISIPIKTSRVGVMDFTAFTSDLSECREYNDAIVDIIAANPHRKFIVLSKLVKHVDDLAGLIRHRNIDCETMTGKKKTHYDTNVLIGTYTKLSTGYDTATSSLDFSGIAADTLILTHGCKEWQNFEQIKGRVMRAGAKNSPAIVWMCTKNPVLARHLSGLKRYIESRNGKVIDMKDNFIA